MTDYELAAKCGVDVHAIRVLRAVESGHDPRAVRFEPNRFRVLTKHRFDNQVPYTPGPHGPSLVAAETDRAAFEHAAQLDYMSAVLASSWGAYQTMGASLVAVAGPRVRGRLGLAADAAVAAFDADPAGVSDRCLIHYVRSRGPLLCNALNARDWATVARLYNGAGRNEAEYTRRLKEASDAL